MKNGTFVIINPKWRPQNIILFITLYMSSYEPAPP